MPDLTPRETEILDHVCRGDTNKAIAHALGVSEQAVKAHVSRLFLKFRVENRAALVNAAVRTASVAGEPAGGTVWSQGPRDERS